MRLRFLFEIIFMFGISIPILSQSDNQLSNSFPENIPDSTRFRCYLDSIEHYLYADLNLSEKYIGLCEPLVQKDLPISPPLKRRFIRLTIDLELNNNNHLNAYKIFNEQKHFLLEDLSKESVQGLKLTEGYILFNLGELESAQKIYQDLIRWSEENDDEGMYISGHYHLAQIQSNQENYIDAEKNFLKVHELEMEDSVRNFNHLITIYELSNLYFNTENDERNNYYNSLGLSIAQELKNKIFTFEFINNMAESAIKKKQFAEARKLIEKSKKIIYKLESARHYQVHLLTNAEFNREQKKYSEALKIYEHLLAIDSKEDNNHTIGLYEDVHDIYHKLGNDEKAYHYLLKTKTTQDSIFNEKKLQQVSFLNTKFEAEQKEKANQLLTSQVLQKQTQNKYLFALAFICLLGILGLFGAYYQKQKYTQQLKQEIEFQTKELQSTNHRLIQSNIELAQFNNILSHDLKEPVRSIVGFVTFAKKQVDPNHKIVEYLQFIEKGGKQLYTLIEDVSAFNNVDRLDTDKIVAINLNELMEDISDSVYSIMLEKDIQINYSSFPTIQSNRTILYLALKNLIENGIKYNEKKPAIINIKYKEENQEHIFLIQDNGIGISKEFHTKIFGMFKRLNDRGKYSGSGLGLSIVQKTIKKIDGKVSLVSSELGKGSIFEVRFPIKELSDEMAIPILEETES